MPTKTEYRKYIAGEQWQRRRKWYLIMHDTCTRCLVPRWLAIAVYDQDLNVHHKSYANVGHEKDEDLEPLCKRCHEIETFGTSQLHAVRHWNCQVCEAPCFNPYNGNFCTRCEVAFGGGFTEEYLTREWNNNNPWKALVVDIAYTIGYSKLQAFLKEGEWILSGAEESINKRKGKR